MVGEWLPMAVYLDDVYWFSAYVGDTHTFARSPSMCVGIWGNVYVTGYWFRAYDYFGVDYGYLPLVPEVGTSRARDYVTQCYIQQSMAGFALLLFCKFCGSAVRDIVMMPRSLLRC